LRETKQVRLWLKAWILFNVLVLAWFLAGLVGLQDMPRPFVCVVFELGGHPPCLSELDAIARGIREVLIVLLLLGDFVLALWFVTRPRRT
jgi:hypothetical protein